MSISFSGSTLTFSDSTTMTTAAVAGPPGPTGPTGPTGGTGPTGPAGSNASVVTTYGAVGSYVTAYSLVFGPAGTTVAAACLQVSYAVNTSGGSSTTGIVGGTSSVTALNGFSGVSCANKRIPGLQNSGCITSAGLSGTWRAMTYMQKGSCVGTATPLTLFVRSA